MLDGCDQLVGEAGAVVRGGLILVVLPGPTAEAADAVVQDRVRPLPDDFLDGSFVRHFVISCALVPVVGGHSVTYTLPPDGAGASISLIPHSPARIS